MSMCREPLSLSIIIPAYNENGKIKRAVEVTEREASKITPNYEIIIAEDGSSDGTYETSARLADERKQVRLLHSLERQGRGKALNRAIRSARGDVICYIDTDLATDMSHLSALVEAIWSEGYDMATGSRLMPGSDTGRSRIRLMASIGYNALVRIVLSSLLHDHQCGFKAFRRESAVPVLDQIKDNHWFWDTEMLVRGQHSGLKVKEIPVRWREANSTKVHLLKDGYMMGSKVFRLRLDLASGSRAWRRGR